MNRLTQSIPHLFARATRVAAAAAPEPPRPALRTGWPPLPMQPNARVPPTDRQHWSPNGPHDEWNRVMSAREAADAWNRPGAEP